MLLYILKDGKELPIHKTEQGGFTTINGSSEQPQLNYEDLIQLLKINAGKHTIIIE